MSIPLSQPADFIRSEESEKAFRRFEPVIANFVRGYNNGIGTVADTLPLLSSTYCVRFRDAVRGALRAGYTSDKFRPEQLKEAWDACVVRQISRYKVYIGPPEQRAAHVFAAQEHGQRSINTFNVSTLEQVKAILEICRLNCSTPLNKLSVFENHDVIRDYLETNLGEDNFARWEDDNTVVIV
jgi:hypothetical protein